MTTIEERSDDSAEAPPAEGLGAVKRVIVGPPMRSDDMEETLLRKLLALPIFASDPFSSVAYATESALIVLVATSLASAHLVFPISIAVSALLVVVILSYRQTVRAYSTSGGSYVVSKENLGRLPSLVAAAALLTDYVLTVAVSVAAGVLAITSAVPGIRPYTVELSLAAVALITVVNLRGVRESGIAFAIPTYLFIGAYLAMIGIGVGRCADGACPQAHVPDAVPAGAGAITFFVLLRAFASGSAALTGIEAISNGVSAFRHPQSRNAARTLAILGVVAVSFFLAVSWLAVETGARPSGSVSVVSQIARAVFPDGSSLGFMFWVVQVSTFAILVLAANTSFQGFPRLAAMLARDRFFPRQFANLGDRLVFSNGIVVLSGLAMFLLWYYDASVDSLVHLYVLGVFTAFTLSQTGMVRHWRRERGPRWRGRAALNGLGALATGVVLVVVVITKFGQGAWLVTVAIPLLVLGFLGINRHYRRTARMLRATGEAVRRSSLPRRTTLVAVAELDDADARAVWYARETGASTFRAVHAQGRRTVSDLASRWEAWSPGGPPLELLSGREGTVEAVLEAVWSVPRTEADFVEVVVPEQFDRRSLLAALTRFDTLLLKLRLLREPGIVITDVPLVTGEQPAASRIAARVLVSGVHGASLRAIAYAQTLALEDVSAVFFAFDAAEARAMREDWERRDVPLPLEIVEAPYRDLGDPLLAHLRTLTADGETLAVVVMPELVVNGWRRLLHNQRALYIKRRLLFEPHVVLSSVPYRL